MCQPACLLVHQQGDFPSLREVYRSFALSAYETRADRPGCSDCAPTAASGPKLNTKLADFPKSWLFQQRCQPYSLSACAGCAGIIMWVCFNELERVRKWHTEKKKKKKKVSSQNPNWDVEVKWRAPFTAGPRGHAKWISFFVWLVIFVS